MPTVIREARPEDSPALAELERLSPEMGRAAVRIEVRDSYFGVIARFPGSKGYVALASDNLTIIGTVFSSTAPTQLNGKLLPATYLFSLRVHPAYRRRGVATTLIAHAYDQAVTEAGARAAWAAIIEGNETSLRTFHRAGFVRLRDLLAKAILAWLTWPHRLPQVSTRPASMSDLPNLAPALNQYYAFHNFWRPTTPERLRAEMEALHHSLSDTEVALNVDGRLLAAASVLEIARMARVRLVGLQSLPEKINRLLSPIYGLFAMNTLMIRHYFFPPDQPAIGAATILALHKRQTSRSSVAVLTADPLDPIWGAVEHLWGATGRVHLVVKSDEPIDSSRPSYLQ